ncbi:MAG TPA: hypothetical protein DIT05_19125 [Morganella sp. (in: Bacteria)]|nr:hypothetical protein [Morganella sp. (in: enterobacteria)]
MLKKYLFPLFALILLAGCQAPSNTLSIEPVMKLPPADPTLGATTISITGVDNRSSQTLAEFSRNGQLAQLRPSRDLRFLLQEALEKQMAARGFMIGTPAAANVQIAINTFKANVQEGSIRHNITANIEVTVLATAQNNSTKSRTFRTSYNVQGPFSASNAKVTDAFNRALSDIVADMAQDTQISQFIKQNARY